MKVVLFCGGRGLRMRGAGEDVPKPMVRIGDKPMLWHVMKYYAHWGHTDFILCLGYKGDVIRDYFKRYIDAEILDCQNGPSFEPAQPATNRWRITMVETGLDTGIGDRLRAVQPYVANEPAFLANYSDGLTDCPLPLITNRLSTMNAFGAFMTSRSSVTIHFVHAERDGTVVGIRDINQLDAWINAGYFAFTKQIFDYLRAGDELVVEGFERLIQARKLVSVPYSGFWRCCDTFKDLQALDGLLSNGPGPWELWRRFEPGRTATWPEQDALLKRPAVLPG
jgi:glucose-1-phosphate cytidylyltransferase